MKELFLTTIMKPPEVIVNEYFCLCLFTCLPYWQGWIRGKQFHAIFNFLPQGGSNINPNRALKIFWNFSPMQDFLNRYQIVYTIMKNLFRFTIIKSEYFRSIFNNFCSNSEGKKSVWTPIQALRKSGPSKPQAGVS